MPNFWPVSEIVRGIAYTKPNKLKKLCYLITCRNNFGPNGPRVLILSVCNNEHLLFVMNFRRYTFSNVKCSKDT